MRERAIYTSVLSVCCLIILGCRAYSQDAVVQKERSPVPASINARFLDNKLDPDEWVKRFEIESREIYTCRKEIVDALKLSPGWCVADVGAGTGLFLNLFSAGVSDEGKVYAVDISPRLIEHMKKRVDDEKMSNVKVIASKEDSIELADESVDVIFICDTYHHFEYHADMLFSIRNALKPGGHLVVIDFERIPGKTRDWLLEHVRAGKDQVRAEIEKSGFRFDEEVDIPGLDENYFLRFQKPQGVTKE